MAENQDISICEERVFESVYNEHIESVRNYVYYKGGDLDQAEDIAQESFLKAWQNCKDVIFGKAKNYIITVAKRLLLNHFRDTKVELKFINQVGDKVNKQTPEYLSIEEEFKAKLEGAISNLNEKQREVFLMNRIDKMTFSEIAQTLDISVKAVEKRMSVALKTLKEEVQELKIFKI